MSEKSLTVQDKSELIPVLRNSLYPGASDSSIEMVLAYCHAAGLDPMQKPVHIVPMWDRNQGQMRDVVMPGIGLYRTQASRSEQYAGVTEPEFGPDITEQVGGYDITYPQWCKVAVKRLLSNGVIAEFTAREFWKENYAVKGGKDKSIAPNAMWARRPYGQIAKCAEAQALRKAFPELGAQPTAEEMEGKVIDGGNADVEIEFINEEQAQIIRDKLVTAYADERAFLKHFKANSLMQFPVQAYQDAILLIDHKIAINAKKEAEKKKTEMPKEDGAV